MTGINSVTTWIVSYCRGLTYSFGIIISRNRAVRTIINHVNKNRHVGRKHAWTHIRASSRKKRETKRVSSVKRRQSDWSSE